MFKRVLSSIVAVMLCAVFTGCAEQDTKLKNSDVLAIENQSVSEDEDFSDEDDTRIMTESIDGITYSISGKLSSSSLFENGPHDYMFQGFSAMIDCSYDYDVDFNNVETIANFATEYSNEKEVNNFVVSDLKSEQISIDNLGKTGAVISFNAANDTGMTVYYKVLIFDTGYDAFDVGMTSMFIAEFSAFSDNREEIVNTKMDDFMKTLSA